MTADAVTLPGDCVHIEAMPLDTLNIAVNRERWRLVVHAPGNGRVYRSSSGHEHAINHMDHAIGLHDVGNCDLRTFAFAISHRPTAAGLLQGK